MRKDVVEFNKSIRNSIPIGKIQIERALYRIGAMLEAKVKFSIIEKKLVDRGALLNSIKFNVDVADKSVTVGSYGVPYSAIHEYGGTIKAKDKLLTIPIAPWAKYRRAGDFDLHFEPMKRPTAKLRGRLVNSEGITGFLLARYVDIKEKRYFRDAIQNARTEAKIAEILSEGSNG